MKSQRSPERLYTDSKIQYMINEAFINWKETHIKALYNGTTVTKCVRVTGMLIQVVNKAI